MMNRLSLSSSLTAVLVLASSLAHSSVFAQAQAQPGQKEAPPLQPLPHPELPEPVLVPPGTPWWLYAGGGLVVVLLLALVLWLLLRPQKPVVVSPKQPWKDAHKALRKLSETAQTGTVSPSDIAVSVSEILRRYFMARYGIPAPFRTTQELFHRQGQEPKVERLHKYAPLADLWDQLAFAPVPANTVESVALVGKAIRYLEEDKP